MGVEIAKAFLAMKRPPWNVLSVEGASPHETGRSLVEALSASEALVVLVRCERGDELADVAGNLTHQLVAEVERLDLATALRTEVSRVQEAESAYELASNAERNSFLMASWEEAVSELLGAFSQDRKIALVITYSGDTTSLENWITKALRIAEYSGSVYPICVGQVRTRGQEEAKR